MFMLAGDDDEPEEEKGKTSDKNWVYREGFRRNKVNIYANKTTWWKGNRIANKIAKDQFLIPYTNLVETLIEIEIKLDQASKKWLGQNKPKIVQRYINII
jgi:hypothetical protein